MEARGRVVHWDLAMCGREESAKVKLFFFVCAFNLTRESETRNVQDDDIRSTQTRTKFEAGHGCVRQTL